MTENTANVIENANPPSDKAWMADLYVSRQKALMANSEASFLKDFHRGERDTYGALDTAKKVEEEFMIRSDFEKIRTTDRGYQQLVEEFAMEVGSDLLSRGMDPDSSPISFVAQEQSYKEQAKKYKQRANKIASEHKTPREKAEYVIFAIRSSIREFVRPIRPDKPNLSRGVTQLLSEMEDLDKQKGQYLVGLGNKKWTETLSRLEALGDRQVYTVSPITPTPPFLTQEPPNNINAMF